jgi:O-antigen/teichoic acid export membrane protein
VNLGRRVGRNALAKIVGEAAARGGGLLFYFLLARWLGPGAFGHYSFAMAYALLFAVVVDLGTNVILTREIARHPQKLADWAPRINGLKLASSALFLIVLAASLPWSPSGREQAGLILALGVLVAGMLLFDSLNALLSGLERMELEAVAKAIQKSGLLIGMALGYATTKTLAGTVTGLLMGMTAGLGFTYVLLMRLGAPAAVRWDGPWNRQLLRQSLPLLFSWVFWNLYDNQDVVVLTFLGFPAATVGHFAAAMKFMDALRGLPVLLSGAVFPILAQGGAADRAGFSRLAVFLLRTSLVIAPPVAVAVWALAPQIVLWIYGAGFEPAADVLRVAAVALVGIFLNHAFIHLLVAVDLQRRTIVGAVGAAVANLVALMCLVPRFGLRGAAAALVIAEGLFLAINLFQIRGQKLGLVRPVALQVLLSLVASAVMGVIIVWTLPAWPPLAAVAVGSAAYLAVVAAGSRVRPFRPTSGEGA